jgi:uncharacterized membrane protein YccF (DUF307 family)
MKTVLSISTVLSWINLVIGGLLTLLGLFTVLTARNFSMLIMPLFFSSIVLHSYAALQLRRSIVHPARRLSSNTPTGIRFIGAVALFFGIGAFANSIALLRNSQEYLKLIQPGLPEGVHFGLRELKLTGIAALLGGFSIALNVMLNFRLLRWYYFMKGMM